MNDLVPLILHVGNPVVQERVHDLARAVSSMDPHEWEPRLPARTNRQLQPAQVSALVAGYHRGVPPVKLAAEMGLHPDTVRRALRLQGVLLERHLRAKTMTPAQLPKAKAL